MLCRSRETNSSIDLSLLVCRVVQPPLIDQVYRKGSLCNSVTHQGVVNLTSHCVAEGIVLPSTQLDINILEIPPRDSTTMKSRFS